jgi:hypothetical protein
MDIGHRFIPECAITDWRNGIGGKNICTFFYIFSLSAIEAWNRVYPFYRASYSAWLTDYMDPNFMELLK